MDITKSEVAQPEPEGALRFMARQPILDSRSTVHGYELLFRAGPVPAYSGSSDFATRTMLDNTVMFGLEKLTTGLPAFINCTSDSLTAQLVDVLPLGMTVLELLETIEPTPDLIAACRRLKTLGYRIALDDFVWRPELAPLVELADYIKVDFVQTDKAGRLELLKRLKGSPAVLVAEKVETQEKYKEACAEGFTLFQGYYFCYPLPLKFRKIPANQSSHIEILKLLRHDPLDIHQLSELVKQDASLTHRFLQLVNSPLFAIRERVRSIVQRQTAAGDPADDLCAGPVLRVGRWAVRAGAAGTVSVGDVQPASGDAAYSHGGSGFGTALAGEDSGGVAGRGESRKQPLAMGKGLRAWRLGRLRYDRARLRLESVRNDQVLCKSGDLG